jgi:hypothetical protein
MSRAAARASCQGRDHPLGHDLAHGEAGEQMVDLPYRETRGLRGQVQSNVAVGNDADEAAPFLHEQVSDALLQHGLPGLEDAGLGAHGDEGARHEFTHFHVMLLSWSVVEQWPSAQTLGQPEHFPPRW